MAIKGYFFNAVESGGTYDRIYNAEDVTSYLDKLVGNGVFPTPSTQLQVRAGSGMTVIVADGEGWIDGHKMINTADMTLQIDVSDVLLDRIDAVVFQCDYTLREMGIAVKKGTLSSTPEAPALQRDGSRYEMCLAHVLVEKQVTAITAIAITDTRGDSDLCGYVQGLIQQMDTTTLFQQWQAAFDAWFEAVQEQFQEGLLLRKLEGVYTTQTANESVFNVATYIPTYMYLYDVLEVFINGIHLDKNEYTLNAGVVTLGTPIEEAGAVVDFVVYQTYQDT